MEFSFDRSNESQLRNNTNRSLKTEDPTSSQAAATPQMQTQSTVHDDGIDTSTIANERLRKAIERNRARQAERNRANPAPQARAEASTPAAEPQVQASLFEKTESNPRTEAPESIAQASVETKSSAIVTRRSVARADEADFTPSKRAPRKVASQISYATTGSRKKTKEVDPTLVGYLVKGSWIFCGIMVLRLIFANGGVTDYYSRRSVHSDRLNELDRIKKENMQLVHEIERMQTDTAFQKKLVRDNLGFIASDEFLVLFPKEKSLQ